MANAVTAFLDAQIEAGRGEGPAIVVPNARYTYREVLSLCNRAGNYFRWLGIEPEQRIALLLPDSIAFVLAFFGALRIGAVTIPLNTRLGAKDYVAILRDSRAKSLVIDSGIYERLGHVFIDLPHLRTILVSGSSGAGPTFEAQLAAASAVLEPESVSNDDMAFWLYTSGTTGFPKAAVHTHRDLLACRNYGADVLNVQPSDRVFATSKLFFAYALGNALLIPLFAGAQTFLHPEWADADVVEGVLRQYAPTIFFSVPTFYARMLRANLDPKRFRSVRYAISAGERLPVEIYRAWRQRFGVEILDGMGATETIYLVLANRPGASREGSSGQPVPGSKVRLLNGAGQEVAEGEQGVLHVQTPSTSAGYWNRLDLSRRTFIGEWFRTGDVYTRDADGYYYHAGREDDLFKVAGMWVSPAEVEAALQGHPAVSEVGVVGADETGGLVKPFAFIVPKDPAADTTALAASVEQLAAQTLAPHQRPRKVFILDELPRTATGKVQRFKLREQAHSLMQSDTPQ